MRIAYGLVLATNILTEIAIKFLALAPFSSKVIFIKIEGNKIFLTSMDVIKDDDLSTKTITLGTKVRRRKSIFINIIAWR